LICRRVCGRKNERRFDFYLSGFKVFFGKYLLWTLKGSPLKILQKISGELLFQAATEIDNKLLIFDENNIINFIKDAETRTQ
jgi:hypothetical protein